MSLLLKDEESSAAGLARETISGETRGLQNYMKVRIQPIKNTYYRLHYLTSHDLATFTPQVECPACGSQVERQILIAIGGDTLPDSLKLSMCRICSHVTYDRLPSEEWTEQFYKKIWDQPGRKLKADESPEPLGPTFWPHFLALNLAKDARILDFGCGFGGGLMGLQALGYQDVYGVEPSEHRALATARHLPGRIRCGSVAEAAQFVEEGGPFDLIVARHVFEHLRAPYSILTEMTKLLKPDGIILIIVPDVYGETPVMTALFLPHVHLFNRSSMMQMMTRAGLTPYAWEPSVHEHELVVAASPDPAWQPEVTHHFTSEKVPVDAESTSRLTDFLRQPWQAEAAKGLTYFEYFQPPKIAKYPAGFLPLEPSLGFSLFLALQKRKVLPSLGSKPSWQFIASSILRKLDRNKGVLLNNIMEIEPIGSAEIPWLVAANGETPVLVK